MSDIYAYPYDWGGTDSEGGRGAGSEASPSEINDGEGWYSMLLYT